MLILILCCLFKSNHLMGMNLKRVENVDDAQRVKWKNYTCICVSEKYGNFKFEAVLWLEAIFVFAASYTIRLQQVCGFVYYTSRILQQLFFVYENKLRIDLKLNLFLHTDTSFQSLNHIKVTTYFFFILSHSVMSLPIFLVIFFIPHQLWINVIRNIYRI